MIKYRCLSSEHPKDAPDYYDSLNGGLCPDCEFGTGLLEPIEVDAVSAEVRPAHLGQVGLCILVIDSSGSMTEAPFPGNPLRKTDLVKMALAGALSDLYSMTEAPRAMIALVAFAHNASVVPDADGKPFIRSINAIEKEFPTKEDLGRYLDEAVLRPGQIVDYRYTNITAGLNLAKEIESAAFAGTLDRFGVPGSFELITHDILTTENELLSVPNVRTVIFSDGEHNTEDGSPLTNPYGVNGDRSTLISTYFGLQNEAASQLKDLACTCPIHNRKGFFHIDSPSAYYTLRQVFRMASGTSGFCPDCISFSEN